MIEPTVRDPVVTLTAPARQLTVGDDFARMDTALIDATVAALTERGVVGSRHGSHFGVAGRLRYGTASAAD